MHFTLGLFSLFLLSLFSPIFASPIDSSDSLPTRTTGNGNDPSLTWGASGAAGSYHCISPAQDPDWAGPINLDDCKGAYDLLSNSIRDKSSRYTFWSDKYRPSAPSRSFQLPWGAKIGSCTLVLRIGRDFGSNVLPHDGGYFNATGWPTEGRASFFEMLIQWRLDLLPRCVAGEGKPGWEPLAHNIGFALVLPSSSEMARKWGDTHNGLLGQLNHTGLGLVEIS